MKTVFLLGILILCLILAVQNSSATTLHVLFWRFSLQNGLILLVFLIIGYVMGIASRGKK